MNWISTNRSSELCFSWFMESVFNNYSLFACNFFTWIVRNCVSWNWVPEGDTFLANSEQNKWPCGGSHSCARCILSYFFQRVGSWCAKQRFGTFIFVNYSYGSYGRWSILCRSYRWWEFLLFFTSCLSRHVLGYFHEDDIHTAWWIFIRT